MKLHENKELFSQAIEMASRQFRIKREFVEKDYWISRSLQLLANADDEHYAVFKGGTSLAKAYGIGSRFSEDIDIAIVDTFRMSGNQLKNIIKRTAHTMSSGLVEVPKLGITSKGSHYYKSFFAYPTISDIPNATNTFKYGEILLEINSFANPYPWGMRRISSFITDFLERQGRQDFIAEYEMQPFELAVLDKRRTLVEKLVSLVRCSLGDKYLLDLSAHIRHFYDLYYLSLDEDCNEYILSSTFLNDFAELLYHDRKTFQKPDGWQNRNLKESLLINDFHNLWKQLEATYIRELPELSYNEIPAVNHIEKTMTNIIEILGQIGQ